MKYYDTDIIRKPGLKIAACHISEMAGEKINLPSQNKMTGKYINDWYAWGKLTFNLIFMFIPEWDHFGSSTMEMADHN